MRMILPVLLLLGCSSQGPANGKKPVVDRTTSDTGEDSVTTTTTDTGTPIPCGSLVEAEALGSPEIDGMVLTTEAPDGSTYMGLELVAETVFDAGGPNETTLTPIGSQDIAIVRFEASGDFAWARQVGGDGASSLHHIETTVASGVVIGARYSSEVEVSAFEPDGVVLSSAGQDDVWVASWEPSGGLLWAQTFGDRDDDGLGGMAILDDDSVVFSLAQGPEPVAASLVSLAGADGTENWVAVVDSPTSVSPGQVAADGLHIAFVGTLEGATTARLGGLEVAVSDGGGFLARVDLDGTPLWVTTLASASAPFLAVAEDGSHFLAGQFDDSATLAPGTPGAITLQSDATAEVFFARLDVDGVPLWAATAHTNPDGVTMPSGIAVGADGHPVVIGYFAQGVTFGAGGPGEAMLVSQSQLDGYVARFDPDGDFQCVRHLRGEGPGLAMPLGIHARSDRTFEINGLFGPSIALSAGTLDEHILPSAGELDAFTSRYAYPMAP